MFKVTHSPEPAFRLMFSWVLVIGALWLAVLWNNVGGSAQRFSVYQHSPIEITSALHSYVANEHQVSPRRNLNVLSSLPPADSPIAVTSALFFAALALYALLQPRVQSWFSVSLVAYQLQLKTLNISRAPPALR